MRTGEAQPQKVYGPSEFTASVAGLLDGVALGLTVFFFVWTAYHIVLLLRGIGLARPGPFDPHGLRNPVDLPPVTIVIPAKQASPVVEDAIRQAIGFRYPAEKKQIIVVEDGSTDGTPEIIEKVLIDHQEVEFLKRRVTSGKPAALNAALPHLRGELVLFMDVDSRTSDDFLLRAAKFFHDRPEVDAAQAILRAIEDSPNLISALDRYENHIYYSGVNRARDRLGLFVPLGGTGMFIKRSTLRELGPWDETCLAEDFEYAVRMWKAGKRVAILPAEVYIQSVNNVRNYVRQRRRWWGGGFQVLARGAFLGGQKIGPRRRFDMGLVAVAPLVMVLGNLTFLASIASQVIGLRLLPGLTVFMWGVFASHILLVSFTVVWTVRRRNWRLLKLVPGIYVDWALQIGILLPLVAGLALRRRIPWETTEKRRMDWDPATGRASSR